MGYAANAIAGLVFALPALVIFRFFLAIALLAYGVTMLAYALENFPPGTHHRRCPVWGHDFRRALPGFPGGRTCRNCLARKDLAALAWRRKLPEGVSVSRVPWAGVYITQSAEAHLAGRLPTAFILLEEPGMPRIPVTAGAPVPMPPLPPIETEILAPTLAPAHVLNPAPPAPPSHTLDTLCAKCFAVIPALATVCPSCGADRA